MNNKSLISSMSKNNIMEKKDIINCYLLLTKYEYYINLLKKITRNLDSNQDGNIGSELVIRPLPDRILHEVVGKNSNLHREELLPNVTRSKRNLKRTNHHVVYKKVNRSIGDEYSDYSE